MTTLTKAAAIAALTALTGTTTADIPLPLNAHEPQAPAGRIQLAILLDTSNSMDGLINQAKRRLWDITKELADARDQNDQAPALEIALYQYGNNGLPAHEGHVQRLHHFTTEHDEIAATLFSLTTNGGNEYCPWVISDAVRDLDWAESSEENPVYRVIFIAGNEPFTQGPVDYQSAIPAAAAQDIIVNTIYCGPEAEGANSGWLHAAHLAAGTFSSIDADHVRRHIPTPHDDDIRIFNDKLNNTYVPFGIHGKKRHARQSTADVEQFADHAGAGIARFAAKAEANYRNSSWDLVDAVTEGRIELESLDDETLPEAMQDMTPAERTAYIDEKAKIRADIQAAIRDLAAKRETFIAEQFAEHENKGLDNAILTALREQAEAAGFVFVE